MPADSGKCRSIPEHRAHGIMEAMKKLLVLAAVGEAATGLALLLIPSLVGELLLGAELTGVAVTLARVTGIALIALGVACWPGTPLVGMLTYSAAVTLYLAYVAFAGDSSGVLLWPAVFLHALLTILLGLAAIQIASHREPPA
jgi:hypothetical protein